MILVILLKMFCKLVDALRQQGDLHIRGTGIPVVNAKIFDRFLFTFHISVNSLCRNPANLGLHRPPVKDFS